MIVIARLVFVLVSTLVPPAMPAPVGVVVPRGFLVAFVAAQERAQATEDEEFFCLLGEVTSEGVYIVEGVVKPFQIAWSQGEAPNRVARLVHTPCPPETIADLHTHPFDSPFAPFPSLIDEESFDHQPYRLHLITFPCQKGDGDTCVSLWSYDGRPPSRPLMSESALVAY